jgi:hypothetical protein
MAQKVEVVLTCDLDAAETPAAETVAFSYRGQTYEFELCQAHLDEFTKVMDGYAGAARRVAVRPRLARSLPSPTADLAAIRAWARRNGHEISQRGRIPAAVRDAFDAARR